MLKQKANTVLGIAFTVLINILLYLMVDGIFAYDLTRAGGKVLS